jgi:hypothetical protein
VKIFKGVIGVAAGLGLCSFAMSVNADVFNTRWPVGELHSGQGSNTAGSYAASTMMGAQGYANDFIPVNWDSLITSSCTSLTGSSLWPASCNPTGMTAAVKSYTNDSWVKVQFADSQKASALNEVLASLQLFGSPAVVPMFGQADHWVAVTQITATNTGSAWVINQVKYYDGGPAGGADSGFNGYAGGLQFYSGSIWSSNYFKVITAINPSCDPNCTSDPYWNQYVIMFEPPTGLNHPPVTGDFAPAPGVVRGGTMTAQIAPSLVWQSLTASGFAADQEVWGAISGGVPGAAFEVHAVFPTGAPWNYFLIPVFDRQGSNTVTAFVQLSADDGGFEGLNVVSAPTQFTPVSVTKAQQLAAGLLAAGESLSARGLTWDPRSNTQMVKSPIRPYYEFGVIASGKTIGTIRVALNDGTVARGQ